jgi:hypothetical protein
VDVDQWQVRRQLGAIYLPTNQTVYNYKIARLPTVTGRACNARSSVVCTGRSSSPAVDYCEGFKGFRRTTASW